MNELIAAAQGGDRAAFTDLVEQHYDQMYRYALKFSGQTADAEDIVQQACIKLARSIGQFRFESAFSTWLYRLVTNCARDWFKAAANRVHDEYEEQVAQGTGGAEGQVELLQVLNLVDTLGEGFRETVVLVLGEGLTHKEAADILSVKESTISWRIHETRKRLTEMEAS